MRMAERGQSMLLSVRKKGMRAEILPFLFRSMIVLIHVKHLEVCNRLLDYVHVRYVLSVVVHSAVSLFAGSVIS